VGGPASAPRNRLPRDLGAKIRVALKDFKYWIDEPGFDDMVYWSENHVILFAAAEYLAGQLMPDEWFTYVPWGGTSMTIRHRGFDLVHERDDYDPQRPAGDVRRGDGVRR